MSLTTFERVAPLLLALIVAAVFLARATSAEAMEKPPGDCRSFGVSWVYHLDEPPLDCVPREFAINASTVMGCESNYSNITVGVYGERGKLQTHPVHYLPGEVCKGMDHSVPRDRAQCAVRLFRARGWQPWASSKECHEL